jgi:pimeloyl-ACP methyl ester carboxylesterase/DNA-binding CsgD family transcriptional regulator
MEQRIRFCTALVRAPHWLTHLEFDWRSPVWRPWLQEVSGRHTLVRFDPRGCGLSDRDAADLSFESWVRDLETVVQAAGLDRFALFGPSQGGPVALAYAVRHPERVTKLVLNGAYLRGRLARSSTPRDEEEAETFVRLARVGWGTENPAFRQVFSMLFMPKGTAEQWRWFSDLSRVSTSGETAARILGMMHRIDVRELAPLVRVPTLVFHSRGDARVPFEEGRLAASLIPGAQFVTLESENHILHAAEPAWRSFFATLEEFLGEAPGAGALAGELTAREREILELIAQGLANPAIARRLEISPHTLRNHISSIFDKLAVATRAEAIVKARESGFGRAA